MSAASRGGRRVAQRAQRSRPRSARAGVAPLVLLLLAAVAVLLVRSPEPEDAAPAATGETVDSTVLACPDDGTSPARAPVQVGLAEVAGLGAEGELEVGPPDGSTSPLRLERGALETVEEGPAVISARGDVAAGLFGSRSVPTGRALAVGQCVAPQASWWFTGAGAALDHTSVLSLTNVDPGPAVLDIRVLSEDGEVDTVATRGVTIAPGETRRVPLADIAPQNEEVAVAVDASRGRVAATVSDRFAPRAGGPEGTEWLTAVPEPARVLRLAGIPARAAGRSIVLANPSELEALVDLEVSGARGRFVPTGAETVTVPPGSVRVVDATDLLPSGEASALRVEAQVPVLASVRSVQGADLSYAGPVSVLTDPAAAPVVAGAETSVAVTAGTGGAEVRVAALTSDGREVEEQRVVVDPAATRAWRAPKGADYLVVTPLEGNVHGAATYAGPSGVGSVPLVSLPVRLIQPEVVPGPR
jgi:hypothetical protein